jgi:predicted dienelactone hydrolase
VIQTSALFIIIAILCVGVAHSASASAAGEPAPPAVGSASRDFSDGARKNWRGDGPRPLPVLIWYPAESAGPDTSHPEADAPISRAARKYPLILLSHGSGGTGSDMAPLGRWLASRGYIAAAVSHSGKPGDEQRLGSFLSISDICIWEHPRDLSAVLDKLLADPLFGRRIDGKRIGAAGFSLGGYAVIAAAGARLDLEALRVNSPTPPPDIMKAVDAFWKLAATDPVIKESLRHGEDSYQDKRIKAVFALAPAVGYGCTEASLKSVKASVRIVVGELDVVTPPATNAKLYARLIKGCELTVLPGEVGHFVLSGPEVDREAVMRGVGAMAAEFFDRALAKK